MKQFILKMKAGDLFFEGHYASMSVKITPYRYSAMRFGTEEFTKMHCDIINRALPGLDFEVQTFVLASDREALPEKVYYHRDINRLVDSDGCQFSHSFQTQWYEWREEFPLYHAVK